MSIHRKINLSIRSILKGQCPACHQGKMTRGLMGMQPRCPRCSYDLHPEPGYYLGAMTIGFALSGLLMIPPTIALKVIGLEIQYLILAPLIEFIFVGSFLFYYAKIFWVHVEYRLTHRLDGANRVPDSEK